MNNVPPLGQASLLMLSVLKGRTLRLVVQLLNLCYDLPANRQGFKISKHIQELVPIDQVLSP